MNRSTDDDTLQSILDADTVAVVGCSSTPGKDAHEIPKYLAEHGYTVIPVNPYAEEILGQTAYDSLSEVDAEIDIVDVFRPSEEVNGIVMEVLDRTDVETVWLQLGIRDDRARRRVESSGRQFVQDSCMKVEHRRLVR
ncbi:CoA-binding protein [Halocatena pleomorpha]|uniref:CoA-binding protein n=1 Tax=Halocatena pleomorpha TaxID=1785090 RepID=A0A3P3RIP5_9EURY|nr:CoA-binding protein [Halocatena pleomorpha]RRJ33427.1 CoA-binding protein [Halocatena pleomorpha]